MKHLLTTTLAVAALGMAAPVLAQETTSAPAEAGVPAETGATTPADSAPAAQSAAAKAGDTVYDQAGEVVGTVEKVEGANFVISTGTNRATLSLNTLASGPKGLLIGVTKAQLDEAIVQSQGAAAPSAETSAAETAAPAQQ